MEVNGRIKYGLVGALILLTGALVLLPALCPQFVVGLGIIQLLGGTQPTIQPWTPDFEAPYEPDPDLGDYYIGGLVNLTIAYIGYSNVSHIIVNWTETFLRASGGYPLVWIKDPDPTRPVNVDGLLVDGFWLMENMELGLQYIASVLSIEELPPRYYRCIEFSEGENAPWGYGQEGLVWANERPVIILPGFKPVSTLKAIESTLVPSVVSPYGVLTRAEDVRRHLIRTYGTTDLLGWWTIEFYKIVTPHIPPSYEQFDHGRLYAVQFNDYMQFGNALLSVETFANNDLRAWREFISDQLCWLRDLMDLFW